ncbi:MAG: RluA family pseudouridine synthase [Deltaproteobacteria bacterium]|nr:RluA family pseudouridine synthase [Deltaproteobacteria bacterium]
MPPHPLAQRAIAELRRDVSRFDPLATDGKMFGVLVVAAADGRIGYLRAFSGMLGGTWHVDGYAPPVFDYAARERFWPAGEAELATIDAELAALDDRIAPLRAELAALDERHLGELTAQRDVHAANRRDRHAVRSGSRSTPSTDSNDDASGAKRTNASHELDQLSRADGAERKRMLASHRQQREPLTAKLRVLDFERNQIERRKTARSRELLVAIHETYAFANARGELRTVRELFAPAEPPGGAGDCAAPKLLALAYREKLRPIAFAEVWCGAPPATGGRHDGACYPACRGKCGPILAHALGGLITDPLPIFGSTVADDEPKLVYQDAWLIVVDKPVGLLSVPGRGEQLRDSVLVRLRQRYPDATGPLLAHRLDLDTSGLLLAATDQQTYGALQRMFESRVIDKRYVAWVEGVIAGDTGTIDLPLRVDLDDRPRQIVDPVHGKQAITEWRVLERTATRTKLALFPRTGRTHQLRVHAAHPRGLGAPIVGDRLYARTPHDEPRLLLHAETLSLQHPHTGQWLTFERPASF